MARAAPLWLRFLITRQGGWLWFATSRRQRASALDNYAAVLRRSPDDPLVKVTARRAFQNYGEMLFDFLLLGSTSREELTRSVEFEGLDHLDRALASGCGAVVALPHMGSWDVVGSAAAVRGYRVLALADRFPGSLNEAVQDSRQAFGMEVAAATKSTVGRIRQVLAANGVLALVSDLPQGAGVDVEFFGRVAALPSGPAAFALRYHAPLLTAQILRVANRRYWARVDPPLDLAGGTRQSIMQAVARRFEGYIAAHPDQWYAFRPIFR